MRWTWDSRVCSRDAFAAAGKKSVDRVIRRVVAQLGGVSECGHGLLFDVEEERAIGDPVDAGQVVAHHDDRGAKTRLDLEDQVVEPACADGIQAGRRLVEEQQLRIERDRPGQRRPCAHPAADRVRVEVLEPAQADQRELELDYIADGVGAQRREFRQRQRHVLRQRQPAPERAVLEEHTHAPEHVLVRLRCPVTHTMQFLVYDVFGGAIMSQCSRPGVVIFVLMATGAFAQPATPRPSFSEFEVASIKPTPPSAGGRWIRMLSTNEFAAKNHAVKTLIAAAYDLNPQAILGGPTWVESDRYDIVARTPGGVRSTLNEQMLMLRKLLADRVRLTFHREEKEMRVYALTVARGGPKLKESTLSPDQSPQGPPPLIFVVSPQLVKLPGHYATMAEFASILQRSALENPVLDRTGLSGRYDFDLEFTPDETVFGGALGKGTDDSTSPNLFGAIQQQLGLRLEATKGPVQALVIDRVERPSEN